MIRVGVRVKLKRGIVNRCPPGRENNRTAIVETVMTEIDGGLIMDRDLRGCRFWNVADVEPVARSAS